MYKTLGERINYARKSAGYTQKGLSEIVGIHPQTLFKYEKNERVPDIKLAKRIADLCGTTVDWLLSGAGDPFVVENGSDYRLHEESKGIENDIRMDRIIDLVKRIYTEGDDGLRQKLRGALEELADELKDVDRS